MRCPIIARNTDDPNWKPMPIENQVKLLTLKDTLYIAPDEERFGSAGENIIIGITPHIPPDTHALMVIHVGNRHIARNTRHFTRLIRLCLVHHDLRFRFDIQAKLTQGTGEKWWE